MFGEIFSSTHDYIKSKLVNPFLGTLIFVWLVRNWLLIYSLFTFDDNFGWKEKTEFIQRYFEAKDLAHEIWTNLWISGVLFISSFIILALTRYITNLYEFKLLPIVYKYSEDKNLVTKERFDQLLILSREKDDTIEKLRLTIERQEQSIRNKDEYVSTLTSRIAELQVEYSQPKDIYLTSEKDENNFDNEQKEIYKVGGNEYTVDLLNDILMKLDNEERYTEFIEIVTLIKSPRVTSNNIRYDSFRYFEDLNLIEAVINQAPSSTISSSNVILTNFGRALLKYASEKNNTRKTLKEV